MTARRATIVALAGILAVMVALLGDPTLGIPATAILVVAVFLLIMSPILILRALVHLIMWLSDQV